MARMTILFNDITASDAKSYLRNRISSLHSAAAAKHNAKQGALSNEQLEKYVAELYGSIDRNYAPKLTSVGSLAGIEGKKGIMLRMRKACMLKELAEHFPLVEGEYVVTDELGLLASDWNNFPANSIALKRETNMSVCYYLYPDVFGDIAQQTLTDVNFLRGEPVVGNVGDPDFGSAAQTLANGLVGLAPAPLNVIGAALISAFWPSSNDTSTMLQTVYNDLQTIVQDNLAQNNVTLSQDYMSGVVSYMNTTYYPAKTAGDPNTTLFNMLLPYNQTMFVQVLPIFQYTQTGQEQMAAVCLADFMLAASLHIAINQELALVDPNAATPQQSSFAQTVKTLVSTYGAYAVSTAPTILSMRLAQISGVQSDSSTFCSGGPGGSCTTDYWYWFTDSNTGYTSPQYSWNTAEKNPPDAQGECQAALAGYIAGIQAQTQAMLATQVYAVVNTWNLLNNNPIPTPTGS